MKSILETIGCFLNKQRTRIFGYRVTNIPAQKMSPDNIFATCHPNNDGYEAMVKSMKGLSAPATFRTAKQIEDERIALRKAKAALAND